MFTRKLTIAVLIISFFCLFESETKADTPRNIYTPRGTLVGDSYETDEFTYETTREYWDDYYATAYPNATQLTLWGEEYSSSRRYNCHGYAWHMIGDDDINDPVWIGYSSDGQTYKYWQDDSYSEVAVQYASMVDYSGDHSATTTGQTDIYISKWNMYPLMRHDKTYCPNYGTPAKFLRKNPATPSDFATIQAAINDAVSGQIVHVDAGVPALSANVTVPSGITLKIHSGTTVNLNGYTLISSGGTITRESNVTITPDICRKNSSTIKGFYSSIASGLSACSSGETLVVSSGTHNIASNLTVGSGITLDVQSGVTLRFASGTKLAVTGVLDADNVTFEAQSGTWYGIEFTDASSSSMIRYCTIEDATVGVHMNNTDIYLLGNDINNNTTGLLFNSGSDGVANSNEITYNSSCGIKCTSNSDPLLFSWNVIRDNGYGYGGVYGDATSIFDLGRYSDQGHNSIYYNDQYEVQSGYPGTIYARYNWWGDPNPYPYVTSNVDWSYYLTSDPNTTLAKAISENPGSDAPIMNAAVSTDTIGISEVDYAYLIYRKGDFVTAANLFETIVHKYPAHFSGRRALAFLYKCNKHLNKASENLTLLDNVSSTYATEEIDALAKNIAAGELIKQGDYQAAIARSEAVTSSFAKTEYAKQALFNLGNTYWYFLDDPKTGETYYRQLIAAYPDDDLSISALATLGEWKPDEPKPDQPALTENPEPANFSLDQNYPNPFNPETTIRYHLAEASLVTIKIFNLLGAEVITLMDELQPQGNHAIQWNGRDRFGNTVANGVYWLRLQAGKFVGQRKLVMVR